MRKIILPLVVFVLLLILNGCGGGGGTDSDARPAEKTWAVSTIAGPTAGPGSSDGDGTVAGFYYPYGITTNGTSLFVVDGGNSTIRKVEIASGAVSTLAGAPENVGVTDSTDGTGATARFKYPWGIATDGTYLYVADTGNHTIRKVNAATGATITLAGSPGQSGADDSTDGSGKSATFDYPHGLTIYDSFLYVTEPRNHTIRKIHIITGATSTLAGAVGQQGLTDSTDGTGTTARFYWAEGIATDGSFLYVTDDSTIRKIDIITGATTTLAGMVHQGGSTDSTDGTGATARFAAPVGIATDGHYLFVGDSDVLRKVDITTGATTTLAGLSGQSGADDSTDGIGATARFYYPVGITVNGPNLYMAEQSHIIREVAIASGRTTTLAGVPRRLGWLDAAAGEGASARFICPYGIANDGTFAFVADSGNHVIRKVEIATGATTTLAGSSGQVGFDDSTDGTGTTARFYSPNGIAAIGDYLLVTDACTIRKINKVTGETTTLGGAPWASGADDSTDSGAKASFDFPTDIATDGTLIFVADRNNNLIRQVDFATGATSTLAGMRGQSGSNDSLDGTGATARFNMPSGITLSGNNLYVTDLGNHAIRKVEVATGKTTTLAGNGTDGSGWRDSSDGTGTSARFKSPAGITSDGKYLYIADAGNHCIRRTEIATGETITIIGSPARAGNRDGARGDAIFASPVGISLAGAVLYVTDYFMGNVRQID